MKTRAILILGGSLLILVTFTYPYWKTILTESSTSTTFPGLTEAENNVFQLLSDDQKNAYQNLLDKDPVMASVMVRAALKPNTIVPIEQQSLPGMIAPTELAYGEFIAIDAVRWASGSLILYQDADNTKLLRLENFRSVSAPDLHIILAIAPLPDEDGTTMNDAWDNWLLTDPYLDLGNLRGTIGNQSFVIAPEVEIREYSMVVIYNATYDLLISAAPLRFI